MEAMDIVLTLARPMNRWISHRNSAPVHARPELTTVPYMRLAGLMEQHVALLSHSVISPDPPAHVTIQEHANARRTPQAA